MKRLILGFALAMTFSALSHAQEQTDLKFSFQFPASNHLWQEGGKIFADAVEEAVGEQVEFSPFPSGQLGKDQVALLKSGLVDVAAIIPSWNSEQVPLSTVIELPGLFASSCEGSARSWKLVRPGGALHKAEHEPQGFRALFVVASSPYKVMTVSEGVSALEDLQGLKIRAGGSALANVARALGGTPVSLPATELYDALRRGVVDGMLYPYYALEPFGIEGAVNNVIEGAQLGGASIVYAIKNETWDALSDDVKTAMREAGAKAQQHLCNWMDSEEDRVRKERLASGQSVIQLSEDQKKVWQSRLSEVANQWADTMESSGREGSEMLKAIRETAD